MKKLLVAVMFSAFVVACSSVPPKVLDSALYTHTYDDKGQLI
ncbi:Uncharacterised protein [BD1-7 clade bacterium]|uniref:Lipoprotein n=1 Tax=BD1-7 clade bacterium TaxID=2029982 RepID=A0A5S9Q964_9GAMM|nr:Uncharacterised protein [BD1-7 clade bacterium]CAA0120970.1 Uncharacterised protein [BD1-7 clade bacterium]